ncbi:hypothetical protein [Raineyella fluvialis]|uniref:Uncharacterized protein n=1 Tax=Raineyella fluvialis TaxID=2662261 RepID=A0A5Q2F6Y5_9ACTN|nr:hypothetical protein [Raineyella fluvialis]QGF22750.1 hypothetical protein Rai3103_02545 [Raineyella fluvialis]
MQQRPSVPQRLALVTDTEIPEAAVDAARALFPGGTTLRHREEAVWRAVYLEGEAPAPVDVRPVTTAYALSGAVVHGPCWRAPNWS